MNDPAAPDGGSGDPAASSLLPGSWFDSPRPVICFGETDPYLNLALEELLFDAFRTTAKLRSSGGMLLLWRNDESVIFGRNQNPWIECDVAAAQRDGVLLVRRMSGGGCVYHDAGNLNYTLFFAGGDLDRSAGASLVARAVSRFGVPAAVTGGNRAAVFTGGNKISGSAFRITSSGAYCHGTVLVSACLEKLRRYLHPPVREILSKGTPSERSPVTTLEKIVPGISVEDVMAALRSEYHAGLALHAGRCERIDGGRPALRQRIVRRACELKDDAWVFGGTPEFTHRIGTAAGTVVFRVYKGIIRDVRADGWAPATESVKISAYLSATLAGVPYRGEAIGKALRASATGRTIPQVDWIIREIP